MTGQLYDWLRRWATDRPSAPALVCQDTVTTWSQLRARVDRFSAGLQATVTHPAAPVGIWLPDTTDLCAMLLAAAHAGRPALLLSIEYKPAEIAALIQAAGCRQVITGRPVEECGGLLRLTPAELASHGDVSGSPAGSPLPEFLYIPTSGTTGGSRIIVRSEDKLAFLGHAFASTAGITARDGIQALLPQSHGFGLCAGFLTMLASGATQYLEPVFHRHTALRLLTGGRVTVTVGVPYHFDVLARSFSSGPADLSHLRYAFCGGAPLDPAKWDGVYRRLGLPLRQSYGSTETGNVTVNIDEHPERFIASSGTPLDGVSIRVNGDGCIGVRSPATATALLSAATGQRLPISAPDGWVQTGDLGRIDAAGHLYLTGRVSQFLNIAGHKVDPVEVEAVLTSHPAVREAVVVAIEGGPQPAAKAIVVCQQPCEPAELLEHCRARLADYKVPSRIEVHDALPRTPSGKVQRRPMA